MKNRSGAGTKLAGAVSLVAFVVAASTAPVGAQPRPSTQAQQQAAPQPAQIDRNGVLILIRSTLLALHEANETGNYTVLRDLSAPGFRDANTAARLGEIFASQRAQKLDLSGVAVLDPQLTLLPQIESNGLMRMAGFFPSVPSQVNFELLFAPVDGRWRVFGIAVNVGSSTPTAPSPAPTPPTAQVSEQKRVEPPKGKPAAPATRPVKPTNGEAAPAGP
ncbi:hypothetical protein [Methylobacterium sp. J-092]|uniref:hypothetical protein n=1 Tax=Methylobacterium sp. J-092 TaxID=2836667 RepID=UPI001FB863EC|nr:hypothetical protein [Methylobacterium sp. J-092]MCJ2005557.1 hypothetical protein [Methylobacterium sp. J-092]